MLTTIAQYLEHIIVSLGPIGVFWGSILEEVIVPIPSSLVQAGAGIFLMGTTPFSLVGVLKLFGVIVVPAAFGVAIGSLPVYFIALYGGDIALRKYGKWFFIRYSSVQHVRERFAKNKHTFWFVTTLRFVPLLPSAVVSAVCGLLGMNFRSYVLSTLLGVAVRALYMGAIGWATGRVGELSGAVGFLQKVGLLFGLFAVLSVITILLLPHAKRKA